MVELSELALVTESVSLKVVELLVCKNTILYTEMVWTMVLTMAGLTVLSSHVGEGVVNHVFGKLNDDEDTRDCGRMNNRFAHE